VPADIIHQGDFQCMFDAIPNGKIERVCFHDDSKVNIADQEYFMRWLSRHPSVSFVTVPAAGPIDVNFNGTEAVSVRCKFDSADLSRDVVFPTGAWRNAVRDAMA